MTLLLASLTLTGTVLGAEPVPGELRPAESTPVKLSFRDFYQTPVGPLGLKPTETLLSLNGRRVRIEGFLVQEEEPLGGLFMMTPAPVALAERADGPADYLPGSTVFVHLRRDAAGQYAGFRPGRWTAVGTLELGAREEANGRYSYVRLLVDNVATVRDANGEPLALSDASPNPHAHGH